MRCSSTNLSVWMLAWQSFFSCSLVPFSFLYCRSDRSQSIVRVRLMPTLSSSPPWPHCGPCPFATIRSDPGPAASGLQHSTLPSCSHWPTEVTVPPAVTGPSHYGRIVFTLRRNSWGCTGRSSSSNSSKTPSVDPKRIRVHTPVYNAPTYLAAFGVGLPHPLCRPLLILPEN